MKPKIIVLLLIVVMRAQCADAQIKDLRADINQSAFDKILNATSFPLTLFEHKDPFKSLESPLFSVDETTVYFDSVKSLQIAREAFRGAKLAELRDVKDVNAFYRDAIKDEWSKIQAEIDRIVTNYDEQMKSGGGPGFSSPDFTIDELRAIQTASPEDGIKKLYAKDRDGFIKAHLAYARVDVATRPNLLVKSPNFNIKDLSVHTTATGELWMKLPAFHCCKWFLGICVCWRVEWKWTRIASLTISPKFGADLTIRFSESQLKIYAKAQFDKLFLDYYILRDIDLKGLANRYMANKSFEIYDAAKFVASLPYINANFRIETLTLPTRTDGVSIEITIK